MPFQFADFRGEFKSGYEPADPESAVRRLADPQAAAVMKFNPMGWYVERLRDFLLYGDYGLGAQDLVVPFLTLLVLWAGLRFFRRISSHFEDFL